MNPLVSIIIPVYNVEDFICECLESVISQTYNNIECIILNDCSADNSLERANELLSQYQGNFNFRLYSNESNLGLSATRNLAIGRSKGEFLYFLDSDDYLFKDSIELLVDLILSYGNVDIVVGDLLRENKTNDKSLNLDANKLPKITFNQKWLKNNYLLNVPVIACNKLIRKSFIVDNNLYFQNNILHEDVLWHFFVGKKIKSVAFCFNNTYFNRHNAGSITNSKMMEIKRMESNYKIISSCVANISLERQHIEYIYIIKYIKSIKDVIIKSPDKKILSSQLYTVMLDLLKSKNIPILIKPLVKFLQYSDIKSSYEMFIWNKYLGFIFRLIKV